MKACPNAQCPHRLQYGTPAAYLMTSVLCRHCAGRVVPVEDLERAERHAPTVRATKKRRGQLGEGALFFLGLAGVIIPHSLAQAFGNIAYALPVLALAYALSRLARRPATRSSSTPAYR